MNKARNYAQPIKSVAVKVEQTEGVEKAVAKELKTNDPKNAEQTIAENTLKPRTVLDSDEVGEAGAKAREENLKKVSGENDKSEAGDAGLQVTNPATSKEEGGKNTTKTIKK